ncbi:MAG TPA: hypothetical protein VEB22_13610 [Phycisphaerales bacterium]|nr:hypothetical protein [Phycisphaerales bacterium]
MNPEPSVTELAGRILGFGIVDGTDNPDEEAQNLADALLDIRSSCQRALPALEQAISSKTKDGFGDGFVELIVELNHVVSHLKASVVLKEQVHQL